MKRWRETLVLWLAYAVIVAMGLLLLFVSGSSLEEAGDLGVMVMVAGFAIGAACAAWAALYELRSEGSERIRRHLQTMRASFVVLIVGVVALIAWPLLPALIRVGLAAAAAGYVFGFLVVFIPNRSRAVAIRDIPPDDA